jgi:hypothetical protein
LRAKCPKCGAVFEVALGISPIHVGPWRYTKCPACGKKSMMNNFVNDPITWPSQEGEKKEETPLTEEELKRKRIDDSRYEETHEPS